MATKIWVNIGSGNDLLPDGTKSLPEPMLTDHQWSRVTFILGQFREMLQPSVTKILLKITYLKLHSHFPGANELNAKRLSDFQYMSAVMTGSIQSNYSLHRCLWVFLIRWIEQGNKKCFHRWMYLLLGHVNHIYYKLFTVRYTFPCQWTCMASSPLSCDIVWSLSWWVGAYILLGKWTPTWLFLNCFQ